MSLAESSIEKGNPTRERWRFIFAAVSISLLFSLCCYLKGIAILPEGPAVAISEVTKSLYHEGSLTPEYFVTILEQAAGYSKATSSAVWQDVFAIDLEGNLRPKHSLFSSVVAVPFYALFGVAGFWIMQQVFFISLLYSTYALVERSSGRSLPRSTLVATCLLSQSLFYSYDFSYDLHATTLLIGGLALVACAHYPVAGGAVMALSVFVRPSNVLLVLPLAVIGGASCPSKGVMKALIGTAPVFMAYLCVNFLMWGDPLVTSYSRLPGFHNGEIFMLSHPLGFDWRVLTSDWPAKLFGQAGLIPFNLSVIGAPLVVRFVKRNGNIRDLKSACLLIAFFYALYIYSYPMWSESFYGNRFLLPAIFLYLIPFIVYLGRYERRDEP